MASYRRSDAEDGLCTNEERERLTRVIQRWNEHRVDLFEISLPNEKLDFYGVIRFFFQDRDKAVVTKCTRVYSTATSKTVVEALAEKFGLDLKPEGSTYALYEVHQDGESRKLYNEECPLLIQLNWSKGDRDGRFVFKQVPTTGGGSRGEYYYPEPAKPLVGSHSKKDKKKRRRFSGSSPTDTGGSHKGSDSDSHSGTHKFQGSLAKAIYKAVPDSRFTRSISNPEAVMRRQRHQKLVKRVLSIRGKDGRSDAEGTLNIYAGSLAPENPLKTIRVRRRATAEEVVRTALEEYGFLNDHPSLYCLVQMAVPVNSSQSVHLNIIGTSSNQRVLADEDQPLEIVKSLRSEKKDVVTLFHIKKKNMPEGSLHDVNGCFLPQLVEATADGKEVPSGRRISLSLERNLLGNKRPSSPLSGNYVLIHSANIRARHCEISDIEGVFTITPVDEGAEVSVNNKLIHRPAFLSHKSLIRLGKSVFFYYINPFETSRMASITDDGQVVGSHHQTKARRSVSPPVRERAMSNSALEEERKGSKRALDYEKKMTSSHSMEFGQGEEKNTTSDKTTKLNNVMSSGMNVASMPVFPHQFPSPPDAKSRRSDTFLSGEVHLSPLPISISFHPTKESTLLSNMIQDVKLVTLKFKLAPAFALYMVTRFHMSPHFQSGANSSELKKHLVVMLKNSVSYMKRVINEARNTTQLLAFWMANGSEFLHFLNSDPEISKLSQDYEQPLIGIVQACYKNFFLCVSRELGNYVPAFFDESEEADVKDPTHSENEESSPPFSLDIFGSSHGGTPHSTLSRHNNSSSTSSMSSRNSRRSRKMQPTIGDVMSTLSAALSILRKNCVNMSLTVQIFSLLVQFLNAKIVNRLFSEPRYCSQFWGFRLSKRLERIDQWAKRQGLEMAVDKNLAQAVQATILLVCPKYTPADVKFASSIDLLNSKQIEVVLDNYRLCKGEPTLSPEFATHLITSAKMTRDKLLVRDKGKITVEEDTNFNPFTVFVLPEMGYMGQVVQGVPQGLLDYTKPFVNMGLCAVTVNEDAQGLWTHQQSTSLSGSSREETSPTRDMVGSYYPTPPKASSPSSKSYGPKIAVFEIMKDNGSLGVSIVGGKDAITSHPDIGIFVKKLVQGGSAEKDGRLQPGDEILSVDGKNLNGLTQERAAQILKNTGKSTTLTVGKQAAQFYGLMNLISSPSPRNTRRSTPSEVHGNPPHTNKQMERMEFESKGLHQTKPLPSSLGNSSNPPPADRFVGRDRAVSPHTESTKWSSENRDPVGLQDTQWTTSALWDKGGSYSRSSAWNSKDRDNVIAGMEEDKNKPFSGLQNSPHPPANNENSSHNHKSSPTSVMPYYSQASIDLQRDQDEKNTYSFVSHDVSALSSQPQPSGQLQNMTESQNTSQHNSYDYCSMDVQHASLTGNSLPHAMAVIAQYKPPKEDRTKGPLDPALDQQLTNLVELREKVKECQEWIKLLESRRCAEEQYRQDLEREFRSKGMQPLMGPVGERDYHHHNHHWQRSMREFEEKRKISNEKLKQIELDRHAMKTTLQDYQHKLKMIELSLEAEESERKIDKLTSNEYSVSGGSERLDHLAKQDNDKTNNYDLQRLVDGKEVSSCNTTCPPTSSADRRQTALKSSEEGLSTRHHFPMSGYGSLQRNTSHFKQKSDSTFTSEGGVGYRSLERQREHPATNGYIRGEEVSYGKSGKVSHSRSKSEGPGEFPAMDEVEADICHHGQHHLSSKMRLPGVGGRSHPAPPPQYQPIKPSSSSESSALQQIVLDEQFKHYNLSPTSDSDIGILPRPPPPGVDWEGSRDNQPTTFNPNFDPESETENCNDNSSRFSEEPFNLKKWGDVGLWKNSDHIRTMHPSNPPHFPSNHSEVGLFSSQHPTKQYHSSHNLDTPHHKEVGVPLYSPRHNGQYNFVSDVSSKDESSSSTSHWTQRHRELQFHSPPMTSQELTSSQITNYHDDIPTVDPYVHNRIMSQSTSEADSDPPMRVAPKTGIRNRDPRESTRGFPSAYTTPVYKQDPILNDSNKKFEIGSPRVMPVTTRIDKVRLHPHHNHQGPPLSNGKHNMYLETSRERPRKPAITTVSRTDL